MMGRQVNLLPMYFYSYIHHCHLREYELFSSEAPVAVAEPSSIHAVKSGSSMFLETTAVFPVELVWSDLQRPPEDQTDPRLSV